MILDQKLKIKRASEDEQGQSPNYSNKDAHNITPFFEEASGMGEDKLPLNQIDTKRISGEYHIAVFARIQAGDNPHPISNGL
jgi:hypothetical protein